MRITIFCNLRESVSSSLLIGNSVVVLIHFSHSYSHRKQLTTSSNHQSVVIDLVQRLHLTRLAWSRFTKWVNVILNRDIIIRNLISHQLTNGSSEDDIVGESTHTNIIKSMSLCDSDILRHSDSSTCEHVTFSIQRHNHSSLNLRDLIEIGEGEGVQSLLQIGLSSHVQTNTTEDERQ